MMEGSFKLILKKKTSQETIVVKDSSAILLNKYCLLLLTAMDANPYYKNQHFKNSS